ncbi:MAG: Type pilus assembly protein PilM, type pilus assembly protein PilM [Candidatus Paceibacter sp.]|jgi:type IV pilus assembly protein PilM|nr:Type pilus assembly protein PilM, type pilus assembly protein PilM [Candidatus Paceibacter sp.]
MATFLSKLFGHKSESVIGVDVGSSSIKIVQLSRKGDRAALDTYGELALGPYTNIEVGRATNLPPEKIAEALIDVIRESKTTATSAGLAIPFSSSLITAIEMPAAMQKQFPQMIPLEARKYIPVPISEVALDWWVIPKPTNKAADFGDKAAQAAQTDKVDVLLVAIHNESLNKFQTIVNKASLNTSFFEIEIFSSIRSVSANDMTSEMIIDLGAASTKVYIVEEGVIRSSHVINRGGQDVTSAMSKALGVDLQTAEVMKRDMAQVPLDRKSDAANVISITLDYIFAEAHQVMLAYQRKHNKDVPKAIMVGGGAMLKGILKYAEDRLQTKVLLGDPFGKTEAPAFLAEVLKTTGPEFAVAVGIALRKLAEMK